MRPGSPPSGEASVWTLVRLQSGKDARVESSLKTNSIGHNAKQTSEALLASTEFLPNGWVRLFPESPLSPGEYSIVPVPADQKYFAAYVYDFGIDPPSTH